MMIQLEFITWTINLNSKLQCWSQNYCIKLSITTRIYNTQVVPLVEKIHQNSSKKSFDLQKNRNLWKLDELISKQKERKSASNITDFNKQLNLQLTIETTKLKAIFSRRVLTTWLLIKHCEIKISLLLSRNNKFRLCQ